ncbi:ribosome-binding factor A domain-containing protein [Pavlovales sp. CCMP2436]|nr:ribosome-binding factor A domain-containing protein [Pavlovales sp. CCMP2436]|mmetsp:Transcript_4425/g.11199  ORF Transcript_4425/g.11199 Transcript_4425/m.11199 type:complete len:185 (+) Transcript_4425:1-555(+)
MRASSRVGVGATSGGSRRPARVGQVVRGELASLISSGSIGQQRNPLKESVRSMISIVDVTVTDDMRTAKVRVSTFGEKLDALRAIRWLQDNRKSIRYELAHRLTHMRRVPELTFVDIDISSPVRVMALIDRLVAETASNAEGGEAVEGAAGNEGDEEDGDDLDFELENDEDDLDFDFDKPRASV